MPELQVDFDGKTVPLRSCFWVRYDKTGCATGSTQAVTGERTLGTADDAQKNLVPRQRDRDRETRQGVHYELVDRETWRRTVRPCFLESCSHTSEEAS